MGIEDDMFNAFKHINFSEQADPLKMMRTLLEKLEKMMLERMLAQIQARLQVLESEDKGMDPFNILGVEPDCTKEQVTKAYREKSHKAHPDHGGSHEEMAKVNAAREAIFIYKGWKK